MKWLSMDRDGTKESKSLCALDGSFVKHNRVLNRTETAHQTVKFSS